MNMPDTTDTVRMLSAAGRGRAPQGRSRRIHYRDVSRQFAGDRARAASSARFRRNSVRQSCSSIPDTLVGTLDYGTLSVARATMGYKHKPMDLEKARQEICVPTFMLKNSSELREAPRICELVRTEITNISVKGAWRAGAAATVRTRAGAARGSPSAKSFRHHILTDLTLSPATVIYDYLTDSAPSASSKK